MHIHACDKNLPVPEIYSFYGIQVENFFKIFISNQGVAV